MFLTLKMKIICGEHIKMKKIKEANFYLNQATFLRCLLPLAFEAKKRGYLVNFYTHPCGKYNCITKQENHNFLKTLCVDNNFSLSSISSIKSKSMQGLNFFVENVLLNN